MTQPEEPSLRIFIECCLIEPRNFTCLVSILNTTESAAEIQVSQVIIEEWINEPEEALAVNTIKPGERPEMPREGKVKQLIRDAHLNQEEKKTLMHICEEIQRRVSFRERTTDMYDSNITRDNHLTSRS